MRNFKNKNLISTIAILMMLSFVVSIFAAAGITYAQTERELPTYPFISAIPKNVGVGQAALINFGLLNNLARQTDGWNVTAVITDPDGVVTRIDGMTWSTGTVGKTYTPTKEGDYKLVCVFERTYYQSGSASVQSGWYVASESEPFIMHVTPDGKPYYPGHNLPTEYWTRPIDGQLREWYSITGSWVVKPINRLVTNQQAPLSSHILWTQPIGDNIGGFAGGDFAFGYQDGDAYEGRWTSPIILSGILYYNKYQSGMPTQAIVAVDVHTGEKLWERSYSFANARITSGQILSWFSYNNRGAWAYIWITNGTNVYVLEARTGDLVYNMTNVPAGRLYQGPNGEILKYIYSNLGTADNPDWHLRQWNSSVVVIGNANAKLDVSWGSACRGRTFNATERGFDIDIKLPTPSDADGIYGSLIYAFPDDRVVIGSTGNQPGTGKNITLTAISIKPGNEGQILFKNVVWKAPDTFVDITYESYRQSDWTAVSPTAIVYWEKNTRINYAFSLETGQYMWKTAPQTYENAWMAGTLSITEGSYGFAIIVYDKLITASVGGQVYCYDMKSGETLWIYESQDEYYLESYLSENWWLTPLIVADGIGYFGVEEHSPLEPKPRASPFFALDLETGKIVWQIHGAFRQSQWGGQAAMGDSIIVTQDVYDQQIYAIGKGPSSVTVTAPNSGITENTPVMIKGTVMDVSPGTQTDKMKLRFANGVPAVSDASMNDWMLYVYKQFDRPTDVTGVPVTVAVVGANGSYEEFYTVSDESGQFAVSYTPSEAGEYTVYAFFDGTNSYYGQWAQDSMVVAEAAAKSSNLLTYGLYVIGIIIILAVLLIGLWLKKK